MRRALKPPAELKLISAGAHRLKGRRRQPSASHDNSCPGRLTRNVIVRHVSPSGLQVSEYSRCFGAHSRAVQALGDHSGTKTHRWAWLNVPPSATVPIDVSVSLQSIQLCINAGTHSVLLVPFLSLHSLNFIWPFCFCPWNGLHIAFHVSSSWWAE